MLAHWPSALCRNGYERLTTDLLRTYYGLTPDLIHSTDKITAHNSPLTTSYLLLTTWYLLPTPAYPLLTTYYIQHTTHNLQQQTYNLRLTAYYLLLNTQKTRYSLLRTH